MVKIELSLSQVFTFSPNALIYNSCHFFPSKLVAISTLYISETLWKFIG